MNDLSTKNLMELDQARTPGEWVVHPDSCHYDTMSDIYAGASKEKSPHREMMVSVGGFGNWKMQEANTRLCALSPELLAEVLQLRGLLWYAWSEFNGIAARDGAPEGVSHDWWAEILEAFGDAIGNEAQTPWPSVEARAALPAPPAPQDE